MITRYSSRRSSLRGFLPELLAGAGGYDRIAGYFRSSILEIAGEALEAMTAGAVVRVICNSDLNPFDVTVAQAAKTIAKAAIYREWCAGLPEEISPALKRRLERLYGFLTSGRLQVRVLPDKVFGLITWEGWRDSSCRWSTDRLHGQYERVALGLGSEL